MSGVGRLLVVAFIVIGGLGLVLAQEKKPKDAKPLDAEAILKLFTEEFISLTPGKGKYPASFVMGSSFEGAPDTEKPEITVTFAHSFDLAKYEVTQELWEVVMGSNPARWPGRRNSVEMLTWDEANQFCQKVTTLLHKRKLLGEKQLIRLPSEAEWEYACRAGTKTKFSFGDEDTNIGDYSWYAKNSKGEDPPVGRKKPNAWGFYDMHGYIWEWCADAWSDSHKDAAKDGSARQAKEAKLRVIRGASFADPADMHRSAYRKGEKTATKSDRIGLRCVRTVEK
jgi:formylglycine-generating enzyme required for sulfatase activity